jgi:hypothetical protein
MDLLRQIDMDLAPQDRRFHKSPHDSQYFCTERYWNSSRITQFFARSFSAERVKTEAENPTFAGFSQSRGAPGYRFSRCSRAARQVVSRADREVA